ncbi:MAG TPA: glycosyltransferase family 4 protein [Candidatus Methylomirabilis sp.]|nr:glycosyltransferase family 4 protein [Candidatus Methylomirabilis sp.]
MNNGRITVLHTEASLGFGGQERRILRELEGLDPARFRGLLLCQPGSRLGEMTDARGIPTVRFKMGSAYDPVAFVRILRLLRRERVDVIHTHSSRDAWLAGAAGKLLRVPVFRTRHLLTRIGGPFVYARLADRVITVSEGVRQYLISQGVPGDKIIAVPTGINLKRFDPARSDLADMRARFDIPRKAFVIGIIAVLRKAKGHRFLLQALEQLAPEFPRMRLAIVGEGPQGRNIHNLIVDLGLEQRVMMLGHQDDIPSLLKAFDVFVLPAQEEALGTALIEATAMGVPVIATRIGGIPEVLGEAGLLFESEDVEALATHLRTLIRSPELAARMRAQGAARARELYDENIMVRRTEELYLKTVGGTS